MVAKKRKNDFLLIIFHIGDMTDIKVCQYDVAILKLYPWVDGSSVAKAAESIDVSKRNRVSVIMLASQISG